jgi:hypothetical protein
MNLCDTNLSLACQHRLRDRLFDDERLLWVGQPVPNPWASPAGFFCLFGSVWGVGVLAAVCRGVSPAFLVLLLPFAVLMCAPLISRWMQKQAVYAITSRGARVLRYGVMGNVSLIYEPKPGMVKLRQELPGGLVNLVMGNCPYTHYKSGGSAPEGFLRLTAADAEKVLPLIRQLESSTIP